MAAARGPSRGSELAQRAAGGVERHQMRGTVGPIDPVQQKPGRLVEGSHPRIVAQPQLTLPVRAGRDRHGAAGEAVLIGRGTCPASTGPHAGAC